MDKGKCVFAYLLNLRIFESCTQFSPTLRMKQTFQILAISSIFYVPIRFLISICTKGNIHQFIYYNSTNDITWYLLNYIIPATISILIAFIFRNKINLFSFGRIFLPILITISLIGGILNFQYWGYFSKRSSVFNELKNANEILAINETNNIYNDTLLFNHIELNPEYYYHSSQRPILAMLENGRSRGNIFDYEKIFQSQKAKFSKNEILNLQQLIKKSDFLDKPEKGYEKFTNGINGLFIEFTTSKENNASIIATGEATRKPALKYENIYIYALIRSGQISNDHFGVYEFLFKNNKIIKKQKFFYDVAGIEYMEYPTLAPFFEIVLLIITFVFFISYKFFRKKLRTT